MIEVTTKSGFHCMVDPRILDDWDVIEALADSADANMAIQSRGNVEVMQKVFGQEGLQALKKHVRDKNGFISTTLMIKELTDVLIACGNAGKKS